MTSVWSRFGRLGGLLAAAFVMVRSGLVQIPRVDRSLRQLAALRKYGPFAGLIHANAINGVERTCVVDDHGEISYREMDGASNALVRAWAREGLTAGATMGVMCRNHRMLLLTMAAAAKAGIKLVLFNTGFARPQLVDVADRENVQAFVHDEEFADIGEALPEGVTCWLSFTPREPQPGDERSIEQLIEGVDTSEVEAPARPGPFVLLTSGTTGTPKGAPREKVSPLVSAQFLDRIPLGREKTLLMASPVFHATGVSQMALALSLAQTIVMERKFDPEETLRLVEQHRCHALVVAPTMLTRILDLPPEVLDRYDTSSLELIFAAGSAVSPDLSSRCHEHFGPVLHNLYGSTEVAVATVAKPEDMVQAPGTAGRAPAGVQVHLYDDDGRQITEPDQIGRIFVSSALAFKGYTDGRDKDRIGDMVSSGDVGHFDADGLLFVDGRDDDMIVSGGENVYPLEVENLLYDRVDVHDVAVIGVDDADFGQRLRAFVVSDEDNRPSEDELKQYVKNHLARYKVPRDVIFLDELPRNPTGKVVRKALQEISDQH